MNNAKHTAILGVGMHPWGKWGTDFTEYGMVAARSALADADIEWRDIQSVADADTLRNDYPGFLAGVTFTRKLGWNGVRISSSYAACASDAQAPDSVRAQILAGFCDVALVIGADTTPKGFFAPVGGGDRKNDPDWKRFHVLGATNPVYFVLFARRRMDMYRATADDFAQVKVNISRNGLNNPNARFKKESAVEEALNSPVVSDTPARPRHPRHQRWCRVEDRVQYGIRSQASRHRHAQVPAEPPRTAGHRQRLDSCRAGTRLQVQGLDRRERL